MNIELIFAIIFFIFLAIFLFINRKKLTNQNILFPLLYFTMYKTKLGLKAMDSIAKKFKEIVKMKSIALSILIAIWIYFDYSTMFTNWIKIIVLVTGIISIIIMIKNPIKGPQWIMITTGFLGMGLISYELVKNLIKMFYQPEVAAKAVGLVLPFPVKGGFYVPFTYWIISIFILAIVHEFSHGMIARVNGIKIKSSGFAFLSVLIPVIPAAFVEPDEKQLSKKKDFEQLGVFAAGPFANIVLAFVVVGILAFGMAPLLDKVVINNGVTVAGFVEGDYSIQKTGLQIGESILSVDGVDTISLLNFSDYMATKQPGEEINIKTNVSEYKLILTENPDDPTKGFIGIQPTQNTKRDPIFIEKYGQFSSDAIIWLSGLLFWLYLLNLGIGLFNLVPLGPVDGGRMLKTVLLRYFEEKKALMIFGKVSMFFLIIILINVFAGFIF